MREIKKLKCAVIREEYVAITGHYIAALILNQLLYWVERVEDMDQWIEEENTRREDKKKIPLTNGWIYKTAEALSEELMLGVTVPTIRKYITQLVKLKFIRERTNPKHKWDKTLQYRVDINAIRNALEKKNYVLQGCRFIDKLDEKTVDRSKENLLQGQKNFTAIPETTTKTTKTNKDLSFNSEIKRDAEAQKTDEKTSPLTDNSFNAARAANFKKSERPSLRDYTLDDLIELFEANPREPPAGISRPQMLAAILDNTPGFENITAENNWKTIMIRLGQLFSDKRQEPLEYCDLITSAFEFETIPKPKDKPANLNYLIAVLTNRAQEKAIDRFEAEHYARKLSHGELREVNTLIADMADDFRMKDDRIKDTHDLDQRRDSLKAALKEKKIKQQWPSLEEQKAALRKLAEEEDGRITGNTS